jgi:hypothetical protein
MSRKFRWLSRLPLVHYRRAAAMLRKTKKERKLEEKPALGDQKLRAELHLADKGVVVGGLAVAMTNSEEVGQQLLPLKPIVRSATLRYQASVPLARSLFPNT